MRIAVTHPWTWPHVQRGGERLFHDLVTYLAAAGHDVLSVSAGPTPERHERDGVERVVVHARDGRVADWLRLDQSVTYLGAAARVVRSWQPDVVHGLYHLDGIIAARASTHPAVVHVQGMPTRTALVGKPVQRRLLHRSLRTADCVVAVSNAAARAMEETFGCATRGLLNGIATEPFREGARTTERSREPTVLFPSDPNDPRKRIDLFVAAMNRVAGRWPGVRISVSGRADAATRARVDAATSIPVQWRHGVEPEAMPREYAAAWVTCAPAVREAFGLVYVESMAAGRPAVGVADGGVPEVIDEPRWLAAPDDEAALAAAIERALEDATTADTITRCQRRAAQFDWSVRGPAFEELYVELLG